MEKIIQHGQSGSPRDEQRTIAHQAFGSRFICIIFR
jgi:hypothetical protein